MTPSQQAALEQVAREWLTERGLCNAASLNGRYPLMGDITSLATLLAAQRVALLEEVVHIQCLKCKFIDQYSPAVVEVGQWMHQHILSKTCTLCDAERIHKYKKAQGVLTP